jgi:hypothetical protein
MDESVITRYGADIQQTITDALALCIDAFVMDLAATPWTFLAPVSTDVCAKLKELQCEHGEFVVRVGKHYVQATHPLEPDMSVPRMLANIAASSCRSDMGLESKSPSHHQKRKSCFRNMIAPVLPYTDADFHRPACFDSIPCELREAWLALWTRDHTDAERCILEDTLRVGLCFADVQRPDASTVRGQLKELLLCYIDLGEDLSMKRQRR